MSTYNIKEVKKEIKNLIEKQLKFFVLTNLHEIILITEELETTFKGTKIITELNSDNQILFLKDYSISKEDLTREIINDNYIISKDKDEFKFMINNYISNSEFLINMYKSYL